MYAVKEGFDEIRGEIKVLQLDIVHLMLLENQPMDSLLGEGGVGEDSKHGPLHSMAEDVCDIVI